MLLQLDTLTIVQSCTNPFIQVSIPVQGQFVWLGILAQRIVVLLASISQVNWTPPYYMGSCDDQHQFFSSVMNNMIDQYLPLRQIQVDSNDKPWITPEVKDLISKRQAALAMA